jgi:pyruvate formate lyase activating enzyme
MTLLCNPLIWEGAEGATVSMVKGSRAVGAFGRDDDRSREARSARRHARLPVPFPYPEPPCSALITNILPTSFVDGPGNRAVVFLQGCNLRCLYCHNPHTRGDCVACGDCVVTCPQHALHIQAGRVRWDKSACRACDRCIQVCRYDSTPRTELLSPDEVRDRIHPSVPFLSGVTVSGGEPTLPPSFLMALFTLVKRTSRLTTLVETNGVVPIETLAQLEPVMDGALVDLKAADPHVHERLTGVENSMCLEAIRFLAERRKSVGVRQAVLPGFTYSRENAEKTTRFLSGTDPTIPLRFLRFRRHGTRGEALAWADPDDACLDDLVAVARSAGLRDVSRGL